MEFKKSTWDSDDLLSACLDAMLDQSLTVAQAQRWLADEDYLLITRDALREMGVQSQCLERRLEHKGGLYRVHLLEVDKEFSLAPGAMTNWHEWASYTISQMGSATGGPNMEQMAHMTEAELGLHPLITISEHTDLHPKHTLALMETLRLRSVAIMERALLRRETDPTAPRASLPRL